MVFNSRQKSTWVLNIQLGRLTLSYSTQLSNSKLIIRLKLLDTANTWKDIANDGNLISVYKSEVYWAAIKPRLDRNYVLYENENFTTTDSWQGMKGRSNPAKSIPMPDTTPTSHRINDLIRHFEIYEHPSYIV